ncbi:oligogalacturonate lyase family protein [Kribbella sp. NPDC004875]|uniref:oligogalacturonate lyase family protein n=1 Tax=Kribbella sp. NPDC004875 TaxID=3364107 RepID=UPI0036BFCD31
MTDAIRVATGAHLTYPHAGGFHADGERLVVVRWDADRSATGFVSVPWREPGDADVRELCAVPAQARQEGTVWFDVARDAERLAGTWDGVLHIMDLADRTAAPEMLYRAPAGRALQGLVSISPAGDRVLVSQEAPGEYTLLEVDVGTGRIRELQTREWWANHAHYCPADPAWIGYSHEGPTKSVPDRVWARHAVELPEGQCVLRQPEGVCFGHERWAHHAVGAVVVAYGVSPNGPRGLYWASPDDPAGRLLSRGDRYWHCDISRDGRRAVVDTSGPADRPGKGWENADGISDILLVDLTDGSTLPLARTRATRHPAHPHPIFTPDGSAVLFNDLAPDGTLSITRIDLPDT